MKIYISVISALILGIAIGVPIGCKIASPKPTSEIKNAEVLTLKEAFTLPELNRKAVNEILAKEGVSPLIESITVKDKTLQGQVKSNWYDLPYEKRVDIVSGLKRAWLAGREIDVYVAIQFTDHLGSYAFSYNGLSGLHVSR